LEEIFTHYFFCSSIGPTPHKLDLNAGLKYHELIVQEKTYPSGGQITIEKRGRE